MDPDHRDAKPAEPASPSPPVTTLVLYRFAKTRYGVIGRLGEFYIMEDPDRDNEPGRSCIPKGEYTCRRSYFNRGGYQTFQITGVPGRDLIKFHAGNTHRDTEGCPLVGSELGILDGQLAVLKSRIAFDAWFKSLKDVEQFRLIITEWPEGLVEGG